jgi:hypothetical protein
MLPSVDLTFCRLFLLSPVLAMQSHVASKYAVGLYGNTMTSNPRGLDVATQVLRAVTPAVRKNIVDRGVEFQDKFGALCKKHPKILSKVVAAAAAQLSVQLILTHIRKLLVDLPCSYPSIFGLAPGDWIWLVASRAFAAVCPHVRWQPGWYQELPRCLPPCRHRCH